MNIAFDPLYGSDLCHYEWAGKQQAGRGNESSRAYTTDSNTEINMKLKLNAPKTITWIIAVVLGVLGILGALGIVTIAPLAGYTVWLVAAGFVLLALGTVLKGL